MSESSRPEYVAIRHILASPAIAARTARYVGQDEFDWEGLEREAQTMSGGERLLVGIASSLWTAESTIGLWDVPRRLDPRSFRRVLEALELCRGEAGAGTAASPAAA